MNDIKLTERFINGITDQGTRQELKKLLDSGNIPLFEFRMNMLRWIEDMWMRASSKQCILLLKVQD